MLETDDLIVTPLLHPTSASTPTDTRVAVDALVAELGLRPILLLSSTGAMQEHPSARVKRLEALIELMGKV